MKTNGEQERRDLERSSVGVFTLRVKGMKPQACESLRTAAKVYARMNREVEQRTAYGRFLRGGTIENAVGVVVAHVSQNGRVFADVNGRSDDNVLLVETWDDETRARFGMAPWTGERVGERVAQAVAS